MASSGELSLLLLPLLFTLTSAATFDVVNGCPYTVWAAALPGGGRQLNSGETWTINVKPGTAGGRIWARTGCSFNKSGRGGCQAGDCGGVLQCQLTGKPPATLAEYSLNLLNNLDFFDISLADGFNVPMNFTPTSGGCRGIGCTADINGQCPDTLRVPGGCNNPCTSGRCGPTTTKDLRFFKDRCPNAYSYPTDDQSTNFTCSVGTNYRVVFCDGGSSTSTPKPTPPEPNPMPPEPMPPKPTPPEPNPMPPEPMPPEPNPMPPKPMPELHDAEDEELIRSAESMSFSFGTLRTATGNFCDANKLGQGGFGPVYKGVLTDGQRIAVKRLLRSSGQGLSELRNEVLLVAKLHHRNLVRLVGFCLEEAEKMVVYEYLPNTSLDKFLFDPNKRLQLDWERRYKLIEGIARGLVYLHEETRFRIIHRDLKASNILLDEHMNPKISDFGLAKIFGVDETHGNTNRIAGTYGYMAPEYAMHGHFSIKSDVFSFGVLVLEIVTCRRNRGFQETEDATDLLSYVWHHWNEGAALQLLDPSIVERSQEQEVLRCIHIGLLCVQEDSSERPNMSEVCLMLINTVMLPTPSRPAFLRGRVTRNDGVLLRGNDSTSSQDMEQRGVQSTNLVSISDLEPR